MKKLVSGTQKEEKKLLGLMWHKWRTLDLGGKTPPCRIVSQTRLYFCCIFLNIPSVVKQMVQRLCEPFQTFHPSAPGTTQICPLPLRPVIIYLHNKLLNDCISALAFEHLSYLLILLPSSSLYDVSTFFPQSFKRLRNW